MEAVLFFIISLVALGSAILVITRRNPVTSILFLVLAFFCIAMLYAMLGAQFIAAMQVIVYAGAIMVLFIFVVMMLNLNQPQKWDSQSPLRLWLGFGAAAGVLLVTVTVLRESLRFSADLNPEMGTVSAVGEALFGRFLYPFEITSVLLLVAIIGVVALIKRSPLPEGSKRKGEEG